MPVGVPKVPFQFSDEEEDAVWVDVYNRLHRQRLLFLGQEIEHEIANQIVGLIVFLSIEDKTKNLYLFINCPGGWVIPGLGLYDMMQSVLPTVYTICIGVAASMGALILVGGEITKRIAFPHARVLIHQPACAFFKAPIGECRMEGDQLITMRDDITEIFAQRTNKPFWVIAHDMERDGFLSATEAQAYGAVDLVGFDCFGFDPETGDFKIYTAV